jgi:fructosamine-3-kinase
MSPLAERAAGLLGGRLASTHSMSGGDLSEILCITLADGREAVVKSGPAPRLEAEMLKVIAAACVPAPKVLAADDTVLVLERLADRGGAGGAEADLGAVLKRLHAATGPRYGWGRDYAFGSVAIENGWSDNWCAFWGQRRLLSSVPHVPAALGRRLEKLADRLPDLIPRQPRPSLLHGDLWSGNVLTDGAAVSGLIDPACYYGDGEVDLAMLNLFGRTGSAFAAAYGVLASGWQIRRAVYTLWPALVHLRLFGSGYRSLVEELLARAGV